MPVNQGCYFGMIALSQPESNNFVMYIISVLTMLSFIIRLSVAVVWNVIQSSGKNVLRGKPRWKSKTFNDLR